jgi:predicted AlkP superfamily pyrophosphatase or phosphodiesterase
MRKAFPSLLYTAGLILALGGLLACHPKASVRPEPGPAPLVATPAPTLAPSSASGVITPPLPPLRQVVVVSWDGFRPDFYLGKRFAAPNLKRLMRAGAYATGVVPVYPTLTYPNHTTMVTGVRPKRHGVISNTLFNWDTGPTGRWYWETSHIQAPTLWQKARESELTTAALGWPVTLGAPIDWLVPEIFLANGVNGPDIWEITRRNTTPPLLAELVRDTTIPGFLDDEKHDQWMTESAISILKHHSPNLLLLHLTQGDHAQHLTGRDSPVTQKAVAQLDAWVGKLASSLDLARTTLVVLGDHGFRDYKAELRLNTLFVKNGWITLGPDGKVTDWKAIAHGGGGQAAVYVRDKGMNIPVMRFLKREARNRYQVISRVQLDSLGAYPEALCAIEPASGLSFSGAFDGKLITPVAGTHGNHGFLPTNAQLFSGLIAVGPGIAKNKNVGVIRMIDIAPTLASVLQVPLPSAEGKRIPLN